MRGMTDPPAIVISKGAQGLAVTRGLGEMGVRVIVLHWTDHDVARLSRYASEAIRVPHPEHDGTAFTEALLSLKERFAGAVLVPTADEAVKDLAYNKPQLERSFVVACPDADVVERFIDKRHTYELAAARGIPIPRTLVPQGPDDLAAFDEQVRYPCLVKPRESHRYVWHFKTKLAVVASLAEMRSEYEAAMEAGVDVVIQELIPGPDSNGVNYNAYRSDGELLAECTARKIRLAPPRFGIRAWWSRRMSRRSSRRAGRSSMASGSRASRARSSNTTRATAHSSSWRSTGVTTCRRCCRSGAA